MRTVGSTRRTAIPKVKAKAKTLGYTIGGPVGKPGGNNKLFFFYAHEYRPVTQAINNGNPIRIRVPTALERAGDFSQTRDNTGALFNLIKDPTSTLPCTAASTAGCFQAGGVLGAFRPIASIRRGPRFWAATRCRTSRSSPA